jgi:hypothetical protein
MVGFSVKIVDNTRRLAEQAAKGVFRSIQHAAASLRRDVISTIESAPHGQPSAPGTPPHTHRRNFFRRAIAYALGEDRKSAVIGPQFSKTGRVGRAHEFGGDYKGQDFPQRSFMGPGLDRAVPRFAGEFRGSIGE